MLRNKSIFQISTLIYLSSISICNLLIDLPSYINKILKNAKPWTSMVCHSVEEEEEEEEYVTGVQDFSL
jgi:hypothetical protein